MVNTFLYLRLIRPRSVNRKKKFIKNINKGKTCIIEEKDLRRANHPQPTDPRGSIHVLGKTRREDYPQIYQPEGSEPTRIFDPPRILLRCLDWHVFGRFNRGNSVILLALLPLG